MSVSIFNNKIVMTRGDTLSIKLDITNKDGGKYTPSSSDNIYFSVKRHYTDTECFLRKKISSSTCQLTLSSTETKRFEQPAVYVYDVEITFSDGTVDTIIPNGILEITEEVG